MKATQPQIDIAVSLLKQAATFEKIKRQTGLNTAVIAFRQETHGLEKPWIIRKRLREGATVTNKIEKASVNTERDREIIELAHSGFTLRQISTILVSAVSEFEKFLSRRMHYQRERFESRRMLELKN